MGKHKNTEQEAILVHFMESHKDIARGFVKGDKVKVDALWKEVVTERTQKDISGWKKVWMDWKAFIRKKVAHNNLEARATGGGPFNKHILTPTEDTIAQLCGIYTVVEGIPSTADFGVPSENCNVPPEISSDDDNLPSRSSSARFRRREPMVTDHLRNNIGEQTGALKSIVDGLQENIEATKKINTSIQCLCERVKDLTEENKRHHFEMERLRQSENEMKYKEYELAELKMYSKYQCKPNSN
ncbi:uncharacterized protein LOC125779287 isoform X2 [Bactrocera dorsalis]|uniref:Uncharacterized protein LOC125779287 isoform X2 n=2 Tax=Bactrocera dorsalis TaxID=27457 RepID=A0ABM3K4S6_BACDO|nr:uncharacterized protein LOC125779287 isoform X2 [Bactrocera dorsalis]